MSEKKQLLKIILKICIAFLPVIIYFCIFVIYEPYNYWGISKERGDCTSPISGMREVMNHEHENIIIGDSRVAYLDPGVLNEGNITNERFCNMAFTGASTKEKCDIFWWANEHTKLKKVVLELNFWNMQEAVAADRVEMVKDVVKNPLHFIFNMDYNLAMLKNIKNKANLEKEEIHSKEVQEEIIEINEEDQLNSYKKYADTIWDENMKNFVFNTQALNSLIEVAEYCNENGIELVLVSLPMHRLVWDKVEKYDRCKYVDLYKKILSKYATIYDMEYIESKLSDSLLYADGNHIYGLDKITTKNFVKNYPLTSDIINVMFKKEGKNVRVLSNKGKKKKVLSREHMYIYGNEGIVPFQEEINIEENAIYRISFNASCQGIPSTFYMDLYGEEYDNYLQDANFSLQEEDRKYSAVVQVEQIPEKQIYFRIINVDGKEIDISKLLVERIG